MIFENPIVFNNKTFFKGDSDIVHYINADEVIVTYSGTTGYLSGFDNPIILEDRYLFFKGLDSLSATKIFYIDLDDDLNVTLDGSYTDFTNPVLFDNKIIFDGGDGVYQIENVLKLEDAFKISINGDAFIELVFIDKIYRQDEDISTIIADLVALINQTFIYNGMGTKIIAKQGFSSNSIMFESLGETVNSIEVQPPDYGESESEVEIYNNALQLFGMTANEYLRTRRQLVILDTPASIGDIVVVKGGITRQQTIVDGQISYDHLDEILQGKIDSII